MRNTEIRDRSSLCIENPDHDERGRAKGRAWLHGAVKQGISLLDAEAHLRKAPRRLKGHDQGTGRMGRKLKIWASSWFYTSGLWGQLLKGGDQGISCSQNHFVSELILFTWAEGARADSRDKCRAWGFYIRRTRSGRSDPRDVRTALAGTHPRRAHDPATGTNGRDNTQLDAR